MTEFDQLARADEAVAQAEHAYKLAAAQSKNGCWRERQDLEAAIANRTDIVKGREGVVILDAEKRHSDKLEKLAAARGTVSSKMAEVIAIAESIEEALAEVKKAYTKATLLISESLPLVAATLPLGDRAYLAMNRPKNDALSAFLDSTKRAPRFREAIIYAAKCWDAQLEKNLKAVEESH